MAKLELTHTVNQVHTRVTKIEGVGGGTSIFIRQSQRPSGELNLQDWKEVVGEVTAALLILEIRLEASNEAIEASCP